MLVPEYSNKLSILFRPNNYLKKLKFPSLIKKNIALVVYYISF